MSDRAQARWADLTTRVKTIPELERRATEATQQLESVRQLVTSSGLDQTEFASVLDLGRLYKSSDPKDLQQALVQLDTLRADIGTRLGVDVAGVDPLAQHPDLKARVDAMELPRDVALEMVKLRRQNQDAEAATRAQNERSQFTQQVQQAAARMDATLAQRASTPGHEAKVAHIRTYFSDPVKLKQFVETYQPAQWEAAVLMMYDTFQPAVAAPTPAPVAPQPLRPGNSGAGTRVQGVPKNAMDAVQNAFTSIGM